MLRKGWKQPMEDEEVIYQPIGKWGPTIKGRAKVVGETMDGSGGVTLTFQATEAFKTYPAPLWRRIVYSVWLKWWSRGHEEDGEE